MTAKIIVALDNMNQEQAIALASSLDPALCHVKVGKELFTRSGPQVVENLVKLGFKVFLDLKFHDIPNTVANACKAAAELGVWMINVHASGGQKMMAAAREALNEFSNPPLLIAVTVLTNLSSEDLEAIGIHVSVEEQVKRLVLLAAKSGMDGVVCSPMETTMIKKLAIKDFILVTPGVRPLDSSMDDQTRTQTPAQAIKNGSDYLVIGRPITRSKEPLETIKSINSEIFTVLNA